MITKNKDGTYTAWLYYTDKSQRGLQNRLKLFESANENECKFAYNVAVEIMKSILSELQPLDVNIQLTADQRYTIIWNVRMQIGKIWPEVLV